MAKTRKTKQDKIISDLRKKLATSAVTPASSSTPTSLYTFTQNKAVTKPTITGKPTKTITPNFILSDLKKTFILTTIAIAAQIVLYFVLARG